MPVGTKGTIKAIDPLELAGARRPDRARQHLPPAPAAGRGDRPRPRRPAPLHGLGRPDPDRLRAASRCSRCATRCSAVDDDGVTFRSVYDGTPERMTPESAMAIQTALGSDIAMAFDECPPGAAERPVVERAVERTARWAERSVAAPARRGPDALRHRAGRASTCRSAAARSIRSRALPFEGFAIGGLSVGEERELTFATTEETAALLPADRPRYFMGIGDPEGVLRVIAAGIDMFDCVLPTRTARTGSALTWEGRLNLHNARFARDTVAARSRVRLSCVCALFSRLHPASGDAARAARAASAEPAQRALPGIVVRRGTKRDRRRDVSCVPRHGRLLACAPPHEPHPLRLVRAAPGRVLVYVPASPP